MLTLSEASVTQLQQVTSVRRALAKAASLVRNRIWFLAVTVIVKKCFQLLPVASTMTMERFVLYSVDSLEGCCLSSIKHYSSDFDNTGWNNTFYRNN